MKAQCRAQILAFEVGTPGGVECPVLETNLQGKVLFMQAKRSDHYDPEDELVNGAREEDTFDFDVDSEDLPPEQAAETAPPSKDVSGSRGDAQKTETPASDPIPIGSCVRGLWLMDTGCGQDLTSESEIQGCEVETLPRKDWKKFETANGTTCAKRIAKVHCTELSQTIRPFILADSPPVLSIGRRCMQEGFPSFGTPEVRQS